ncbi:helix-turn-helix domain-containing protein [Ulvibacterium sp.]|uniref:helix-turn-helix domain-containing protein n=1 Tax=Ulvibacterium sp. TaxID=2665914 RepID=UPI003BA892B6
MSCSQEFAFLLLLSMLLYCFFGYYEILNYKKTIKTVTTAISIPEIKWLKLLLLVMLAIIVCNILSTALPEVIIFGESLSTETIVQFEVLILVNLITFQGLKNPQYFRQIGRDDVRLVKEIYRMESTSRKREHTLVSDKEEIPRIEEYLEKNKPYLNSDLTLSMLSEELNLHPKLLSQIINQHFKVNFSEYINTLRVKHAKYLLESTKDTKLTIMEVMYDSGFNSRSVFNTFFKKKLGVTPSEFISGLKND